MACLFAVIRSRQSYFSSGRRLVADYLIIFQLIMPWRGSDFTKAHGVFNQRLT
jgi:hypothetical protein